MMAGTRHDFNDSSNVATRDQHDMTDVQQDVSFFLLACRSDGLSPMTILDYQRKLAVFAAFLEAQGVETTKAVERVHIRRWELELQERMAMVSVGDYIRVVRRWCNWLVAEGTLKASPCAGIRPPKGDEHSTQTLSIEQIEDMLAVCDLDYQEGFADSWLGVRNKALLLVLLDTGIRRAEAARMQLQHLSHEVDTIRVIPGKNHRERVVGLHVKTQKALLRYLMLRRKLDVGHDFVWVSRELTPLIPESITNVVCTLGKRAGVKGVRCSPHTFRHTSATMALLNGATERDVKDELGHKTDSMVHRYTATIGSEHAAERHKAWSPVGNLRVR